MNQAEDKSKMSLNPKFLIVLSAAWIAVAGSFVLPKTSSLARSNSAGLNSAASSADPTIRESAPDLASLPTGRYYFAPAEQSSEQSSASRKRSSFILFRKSGRTIIGWDHRSVSGPACFRGFIEGEQVVNATRVLAPYQPDSALQQGETIDLSGYESTAHEISAVEAQTLQTCVGFFWR